jgi:hypothetical protein
MHINSEGDLENMAILETEVRFANVEDVAVLSGDQNAETVREQFIAFYPYLANCTYVESVDEISEVKTIVFSERLGTKG